MGITQFHQKCLSCIPLHTSPRGLKGIGLGFRVNQLLSSETLGAWKILGHFEIVLFSLNPRSCIVAFSFITVQYFKVKSFENYESLLYASLVKK